LLSSVAPKTAQAAAPSWPSASAEDSGFAPDLADRLDAGIRSGLLGGLIMAVERTVDDRRVSLRRRC
jgi:hypothetical protein